MRVNPLTLVMVALFTISVHTTPARADAVSTAERYLGTNPTKMRSRWCANFMNMIERKVGRPGTGSNLAASYLKSKHYKRIPRSQLRRGDIVWNGRKGGSHVSYFVGWVECKTGKCARTISGNTSRRVKYATRNPKALVALRPVGGSKFASAPTKKSRAVAKTRAPRDFAAELQNRRSRS